MDRSGLFKAASRLVQKFISLAPRRKAILLAKPNYLEIAVRVSFAIVVLTLVSFSIFLVNSYRSYAKIVDGRLSRGYLTSRGGIYASPRTLRVGQKYSREDLAVALRRAGYVETRDATDVWNGTFAIYDDEIVIQPNNNAKFPSRVSVKFENRRIAGLSGD